MTQEPGTNKSSLKDNRKASPFERRQAFRKAGTLQANSYQSGADSVKHVKAMATVVPVGSKRGIQRQNSGSPTPTRKISPLKKVEAATKVFRGIALQQSQ